jgi:hypothetical protein
MSVTTEISVRACPKVQRLLGRRIRVRTPEYDGYGEVTCVMGHTDAQISEHIATVALEVNDADDQE